MVQAVSYEEVEKDIRELNGALKTIEKPPEVEKAINNLIQNVKFQASELKKEEEEIEKIKNYTQNTLEGFVTPVWLLNLDDSVNYVNCAFERVLGCKREECIGNSLEEFMAKIIGEKDAPVTADKVKKRLKSGETSMNTPLTMSTKERKEFPILYSAAPIKDNKGNITEEVISGTDITELRRREAELNLCSARSKRLPGEYRSHPRPQSPAVKRFQP